MKPSGWTAWRMRDVRPDDDRPNCPAQEVAMRWTLKSNEMHRLRVENMKRVDFWVKTNEEHLEFGPKLNTLAERYGTLSYYCNIFIIEFKSI